MRYKCNGIRRLGDRLLVILCQTVRDSMRAVSAGRNTQVFLTEIRVLADEANALSTELVMNQNVNEEMNAETWTTSKKRCEIHARRDSVSHEIDVSKELDADFNFPKIHLMSHCVKQIRRYGALQQYCAKTHEQAHKTNLKDGLNASNDNLNYLPQAITFQRPIL